MSAGLDVLDVLLSAIQNIIETRLKERLPEAVTKSLTHPPSFALMA
jgi:hypothetical protein